QRFDMRGNERFEFRAMRIATGEAGEREDRRDGVAGSPSRAGEGTETIVERIGEMAGWQEIAARFGCPDPCCDDEGKMARGAARAQPVESRADDSLGQLLAAVIGNLGGAVDEGRVGVT